MLGYNMGKADLTNLFIEGQKVSLEAVNITVDDRKKYPGEQKFENCLKINHENTMHQYKPMVENCLKKNGEQVCRTNTSIEPLLCGRASSGRETTSTRLFQSLFTLTTGKHFILV